MLEINENKQQQCSRCVKESGTKCLWVDAVNGDSTTLLYLNYYFKLNFYLQVNKIKSKNNQCRGTNT